ncbi:MAG: selenide, water dikinase SelD, partial [Chloroflexi bacterium]|nr:selenide, water dikinase SelD [Chloroflexota bacterium]
MRPLSEKFKSENFPALIVGLGAPDDAAVYRVNATTAIIQTMDFFPPVVDDPYAFGAIAAANALSDVYAMGGQVIFALNLAAWREELPLEWLSEIFRGGADKVAEAGAAIAGGHTITDNEPKYGLSVTGTIHPDQIIKKGGARVGDKLILTKPLGNGLITTAGKHGTASDAHMQNAIEWMMRLNAGAAQAMQKIGVNAATDITGFGLLGHAFEMADAARVAFELRANDLPLLDGALEYAAAKQIPGGSGRNRLYLDDKVFFQTELRD